MPIESSLEKQRPGYEHTYKYIHATTFASFHTQKQSRGDSFKIMNKNVYHKPYTGVLITAYLYNMLLVTGFIIKSIIKPFSSPPRRTSAGIHVGIAN